MKRMLSMLLAIALGSAALAACGVTSPPSTTSPPTLGTVSGTFTLVAGLSVPLLIDGTVSFTRQHKIGSVKVTVGDTGKFTVRLPPGKWFVSGRSPKFNINNHQAACGPIRPITVAADKTTSVQVQCNGK
jgi:hypothetical protein